MKFKQDSVVSKADANDCWWLRGSAAEMRPDFEPVVGLNPCPKVGD